MCFLLALLLLLRLCHGDEAGELFPRHLGQPGILSLKGFQLPERPALQVHAVLVVPMQKVVLEESLLTLVHRLTLLVETQEGFPHGLPDAASVSGYEAVLVDTLNRGSRRPQGSHQGRGLDAIRLPLSEPINGLRHVDEVPVGAAAKSA